MSIRSWRIHQLISRALRNDGTFFGWKLIGKSNRSRPCSWQHISALFGCIVRDPDKVYAWKERDILVSTMLFNWNEISGLMDALCAALHVDTLMLIVLVWLKFFTVFQALLLLTIIHSILVRCRDVRCEKARHTWRASEFSTHWSLLIVHENGCRFKQHARTDVEGSIHQP